MPNRKETWPRSPVGVAFSSNRTEIAPLQCHPSLLAQPTMPIPAHLSRAASSSACSRSMPPPSFSSSATNTFPTLPSLPPCGGRACSSALQEPLAGMDDSRQADTAQGQQDKLARLPPRLTDGGPGLGERQRCSEYASVDLGMWRHFCPMGCRIAPICSRK